MRFSSCSPSICPWAKVILASGTSRRIVAAISSMSFTRLCTKNTCPPRLSSRATASRIKISSNTCSSVVTGWRLGGGVAITLRSRAPISEKCSVRGIGVAESVSVSTFTFSSLSLSLVFTPNFCSSSIISRPRSLNLMSLFVSRCVPIRMSVLPSATRCRVSLICFVDLKRLMYSTVTGRVARRSRNVL